MIEFKILILLRFLIIFKKYYIFDHFKYIIINNLKEYPFIPIFIIVFIITFTHFLLIN